MKHLFSIIIIITALFAATSANSQWVEKQGYKEIQFNIPEIGNGYLSEDGTVYYFTDGKAIIKLNIETGDTSRIFDSPKIWSIHSFFISENETKLYFIAGEFINIYDKKIDSLLVSNKYFELEYDDSGGFQTYTAWSPLNIRLINGTIRCFANIHTDDYYTTNLGGYMIQFTQDSLKELSSRSIVNISKYCESKDGDYVVFDGLEGSYNDAGGLYSDEESHKMWFMSFPNNTYIEELYHYTYNIYHPLTHSEDDVYYSFLPAQAFSIFEKSKRIVLIGSDGYLYDYNLKKKEFIRSNYVGNFTNMAADFNERFFASSNDSMAVFFDLVANYTIDTIKFENKSAYHIISLPKDNEYLVFCKNKTIKHLKFKQISELEPYIVADKNYIEINDDISFEGYSTGNPTSWHWQFSDGFESFTKSVKKNFPNHGIHWVDLTVSDGIVSKTVRLDSINIRPELRASFYIDRQVGFVPMTVAFSNYSKGTISKYEWDFGDGEISNEEFPTHTYSIVGEFAVTLTVWDSTLTSKTVHQNIIKTKLGTLNGLKFIDSKLSDETYPIDSLYENINGVDFQPITENETMFLVDCQLASSRFYSLIKVNHILKTHQEIQRVPYSNDVEIIANNDTLYLFIQNTLNYYNKELDAFLYIRDYNKNNQYVGNMSRILSQPKTIDNFIYFNNSYYYYYGQRSKNVACLMNSDYDKLIGIPDPYENMYTEFLDMYSQDELHIIQVGSEYSNLDTKFWVARGNYRNYRFNYVGEPIENTIIIRTAKTTYNNIVAIGTRKEIVNGHFQTRPFIITFNKQSIVLDSTVHNITEYEYTDFVQIDSTLIVVGNFGKRMGYYVYDLELNLIDSNFTTFYENVNQSRIIAYADGSIMVAGTNPEGKLMYYRTAPLFKSTGILQKAAASVCIFPNPIKAGENLTISKLGEGIHSVGIYNTLGIEVYSNDNIYDNQSIKISPLPVGMYFINIRSGSEVRTEKIIVY